MARIKQRRAAKLLVENLNSPNPLTGAEIVANSGYGPSMSKNPKVVLESIGVKEELKNYGFDSDKAKEVVGEILIAGENDTVRLNAAKEIFKVNGDYAAEKHVNLNINQNQDSKLDKLITKIEDELDAGA